MKKPITPNSIIYHALRLLFLRSRERAAALRRDDYTCQICGKRQTKKKGQEIYVEVHHINKICNWDEIYSVIRKNLLCDHSELITHCKECHKKKTREEI